MKPNQILNVGYDRLRFWLAATIDLRHRPRILLLADKRGGAFDICARHLRFYLQSEFCLDIRYVHESPALSPAKYDLIYVFFWGEAYHRRFRFNIDRTIKEVSSHRWQDDPQYGPCTPEAMADRHLGDAGSVICTSKRLYALIHSTHHRVFHASNGFDPLQFRMVSKKTGAMVIGWAGNRDDKVKGVEEIVKPACEGRFQLLLAPGGLPHSEMNDFYNRIDVCAIASIHEGTPLPLLESMAAGCFPVCTDVGVVPELIRDGENGLIVKQRTPQAFRAAFAWCQENLERVRKAGMENADAIRHERSWERSAPVFRSVLLDALRYATRPRFRNDDVSPDVPLDHFRNFCAIFHKYGYDQLHGILLRGRTIGAFKYGSEEAQYEGEQPISRIPNRRIRELSEGIRFEDRQDLIWYLRQSPDEIAMHGLYHTDYSAMTAEEQREDMATALELLGKIFPRKRVRHFVAPFNRTNKHTYEVAAEFGLKVLAAEGVHLEEHLHDLTIEPGTWYRYHHHRFYPESTFRYYKLSFEALDGALARSAERLNHDSLKCASPS